MNPYVHPVPEIVVQLAAEEVAALAGIPVRWLFVRSRRRRFTLPRHALMWLLHRRGWRVAAIARALQYDRTAVETALRTMAAVQAGGPPAERRLLERVAALPVKTSFGYYGGRVAPQAVAS